jgi:hypothetical protein
MARTTWLLALTLKKLGFVPIAYGLGLLAWQAVACALGAGWVGLPGRLLVDPSLLANPQLASIAPFIPSFHWGWANDPHSLVMASKLLGVLLDRVHLGVFAALAGYGLIALGRELAARQAYILEWDAQQRADRLRRVAQYANS